MLVVVFVLASWFATVQAVKFSKVIAPSLRLHARHVEKAPHGSRFYRIEHVAAASGDHTGEIGLELAGNPKSHDCRATNHSVRIE